MEDKWQLNNLERVVCLDHGVDPTTVIKLAREGNEKAQDFIIRIRKWLEENLPGVK